MRPRIGFVTCVELGKACIEEVLGLGGRFDLLLTLHDNQARSKSGRIWLDDLAQQNSMRLEKISHINSPESLAILEEAQLDWLFIIGWSQVASREVLSSVREGVLGMHPTLLPQGRGRASIPWAILKGLNRTGVTLFALDEGVDTGPIAGQIALDIAPDETAGTLYPRIAKAHRTLMAEIWPRLQSGDVTLRDQEEAAATYWSGRTPEDGLISDNMSVDEVDRLVRATTRPYPGAFLKRPSGVYTIWSGKPMDCGSTEYGFEIQCRDGIYLGSEYELRAQ